MKININNGFIWNDDQTPHKFQVLGTWSAWTKVEIVVERATAASLTAVV